MLALKLRKCLVMKLFSPSSSSLELSSKAEPILMLTYSNSNNSEMIYPLLDFHNYPKILKMFLPEDLLRKSNTSQSLWDSQMLCIF